MNSWDEWPDEEFLDYMETHSQTLRAAFHSDMVIKLHKMAKEPLPVKGRLPTIIRLPSPWAQPLVEKARDLINKTKV